MTQITLDDVLRAKLQGLTEPIELCDDSGKVVARVFPAVDPSEYETWEPPMTEEDFRNLVQVDEKCYTTEEVLRHLEGM